MHDVETLDRTSGRADAMRTDIPMSGTSVDLADPEEAYVSAVSGRDDVSSVSCSTPVTAFQRASGGDGMAVSNLIL